MENEKHGQREKQTRYFCFAKKLSDASSVITGDISGQVNTVENTLHEPHFAVNIIVPTFAPGKTRQFALAA